MNWRNVKLVWLRELRDQFRDRRSLFMVVVLPVLLYPLLGATALQLSGFMRREASRVLIIGSEQLADVQPPLLAGESFAPSLVRDQVGVDELKLTLRPSTGTDQNQLLQAREALERGEWDVVIHFPPGFAEQLESARDGPAAASEAAQLTIDSNLAREQSSLARIRVENILDRWYAQIVRGNLAARDVPEAATRPFRIEVQDVASPGSRQAAMWSRLLPFVVFVWALTGAFYPAVDLCAGEKERGTLEALLTCPALRSEIVTGKLLTVITFSITSALANMLSMGLTGRALVAQLNLIPGGDQAPLDAPPLMAAVWLLLALVPMSALFSALSLAVAAYARSTKEGQYYLMPLLLVSLPLMVLPIAPGVELTWGTSLLPISGMVLLLRAAIEGQWSTALPYIPSVLAVTALCCWLAIRWAVLQFNRESVLFRDSESFSVGLWLRKLYVDRPALPTGGLAMACIAAIFTARFALQTLPVDLSPNGLIRLIVLSQACILVPTLLFALGLTRDAAASLRIRFPAAWWQVIAAALLAITWHPLAFYLQTAIQYLFPISDPEALKSFAGKLGGLSLATQLLLIAVVAPMIEELAFRGFMLTGLRRSIGPTAAVLVTAVAFGFIHSILQQSVNATILGLLLGLLALKSGSIWPGVAFHAVNNALMVLRTTPKVDAWLQDNLSCVLSPAGQESQLYSPIFTAICGVFALILALFIVRPLPQQAPQELRAAAEVSTNNAQESG